MDTKQDSFINILLIAIVVLFAFVFYANYESKEKERKNRLKKRLKSGLDVDRKRLEDDLSSIGGDFKRARKKLHNSEPQLSAS